MEAQGLVPLGERGGVHLYYNEEALPRGFVVEQVTAVNGLEEALTWLAANDPARAAAVDGGIPLEGQGEAREARLVERTPNRIEVKAEGPGLMVLSEIYDPDWQAEVDGRTAEIVRANGILRGVYLEEGMHRITFIYRPAGLTAGCGVTAVGWICAVALWIVHRRRTGDR
jgi:hypothetical protein